jgi:integrase
VIPKECEDMIQQEEAMRAKPRDKMYRIQAEKGLFLEVRPTGTKLWKFRYSQDKTQKIITIGEFPKIGVTMACVKRDEALTALAQGSDLHNTEIGLDSSAIGREEARGRFEAVVNSWLALQRKEPFTEHYKDITEWRVRKYILPTLRDKPASDITSLDLLHLCQDIQEQGLIDTAHRVMTILGQIFRYAIILGYVQNDPTYPLKRGNALVSSAPKHYPSIQDEKKLGQFWNAIDATDSSIVIKAAIKFLILNFPRPGELRNMEWSEIDWVKKQWRVPAAKMKMRRDHIVPLSSQSIELLQAVKLITGQGRYVFASPRSWTGNRQMSEATINSTFRAMGYERDEVTAHGFRHTASTMLNESGLWSPDAIERELAHVEENKIRGTYNAAQYLEERARMMQWWSDKVVGLAEVAKEKAKKSAVFAA